MIVWPSVGSSAEYKAYCCEVHRTGDVIGGFDVRAYGVEFPLSGTRDFTLDWVVAGSDPTTRSVLPQNIDTSQLLGFVNAPCVGLHVRLNMTGTISWSMTNEGSPINMDTPGDAPIGSFVIAGTTPSPVVTSGDIGLSRTAAVLTPSTLDPGDTWEGVVAMTGTSEFSLGARSHDFASQVNGASVRWPCAITNSGGGLENGVSGTRHYDGIHGMDDPVTGNIHVQIGWSLDHLVLWLEDGSGPIYVEGDPIGGYTGDPTGGAKSSWYKLGCHEIITNGSSTPRHSSDWTR